MPPPGTMCSYSGKYTGTAEMAGRFVDGGAEYVTIGAVVRLRVCKISPHFMNAPGFAFHMKKLVLAGIDGSDLFKKGVDVPGIGSQEVVVGIYNGENFPYDGVAGSANRFAIPGA